MYSETLTKEIEEIIKTYDFNCTVEKFQDKVYDWICISINQKLSEEFIEKFQDKVHWCNISQYQNLSTEFKNKWKHKWKHKWTK